MVVENGYSTNINNTSNENSSYSSSFMDTLQNIVRELEAQLAQHDEIVKVKDQEIARLENENKQLRAATTPHFYHQNQQRFQNFDRYDFRQKAPEFKQEVTRAVEKALQNFLGEQIPNSQSPSRPQGSWNALPIIQVTQSPLTTQPPTPDRSIDDNSTNVSSLNNLISNDVSINQSAFQQVQDHRSNTSPDLVEDSKEESREQSTYNNNHINNDSELKQNSQQSSSISSLNGITHNRRYSPNNNGNSNNNNNNNINKRRAYTQYTAFVSWQGPTAPPLKSFFPPEDVKEIRQSPNKSFAHIDFTNNDALERALNRNNTPLNPHGIPGSLRVERGKPRSNTTGNENIQRPQYQNQNQNQNKYPQKKDRNGFNSTPSHNHHPHFAVDINNGYSNHNGHNSDSYAPQEDKTLPWQQFSMNNGELPASQPSNQQDHNKNPEDC